MLIDTITSLAARALERMLDSRASMVSASSTTQREALAMRMACYLLVKDHISSAAGGSDIRSVIRLCSIKNVPTWECTTVMEDIQSFSSSSNCKFSWVPRVCNRVAHGVTFAWCSNWLSIPHPQLYFVDDFREAI